MIRTSWGPWLHRLDRRVARDGYRYATWTPSSARGGDEIVALDEAGLLGEDVTGSTARARPGGVERLATSGGGGLAVTSTSSWAAAVDARRSRRQSTTGRCPGLSVDVECSLATDMSTEMQVTLHPAHAVFQAEMVGAATSDGGSRSRTRSPLRRSEAPSQRHLGPLRVAHPGHGRPGPDRLRRAEQPAAQRTRVGNGRARRRDPHVDTVIVYGGRGMGGELVGSMSRSCAGSSRVAGPSARPDRPRVVDHRRSPSFMALA